MTLEISRNIAGKVKEEFKKIIVGQDDVLEGMLAALFAGGHVVLEGVPGTAKTLMVKILAHLLGVKFRRIQFTPDLMPSDVLGTSVFDLKTSSFHLKKGPIFTDFVLADEINRTPPKTQSALLEAMEERQVSLEGESYPLSATFMVFATQNPVEYEGTYPLPEAQLDRFMMMLKVNYPTEKQEDEILRRHHQGLPVHHPKEAGLSTVTDQDELKTAINSLKDVTVEEGILKYIRSIVRAGRSHPDVFLGPSPRAGVMLLLASKALAALRGKNFLTPDEVKYLAFPVFRHRLILKPEAEIEGITPDSVIERLLTQVEVPR
ncbi:MAG: MoxR family ATPase [Candidatus Eremiobacteraeota bacterium]|nr:MoxR family ATPase [Candidatus Eremiobacteraeota bacterium]